MRIAIRFLSVLALFVGGHVLAEGGADLGLSYDTVVQGKKKPALVLNPNTAIKKIVIKLAGNDGRTQTLRAGAIKAGKTKRLKFRLGVGTTEFSADVEVLWADKTTSKFRSGFSATRVGPLEIAISAKEVDLDSRRLACTATNPARRISLSIYGKSGEVIEEVEKQFDSPVPSGSPLELEWPELSEDILRMDLRVTDIAGFYTGVRITPFTIEIPHAEVEFETGKANIRDSEAPKLAETMGHVQKALKAHGTLLSLKLFVAGYTDTVGSKGANRELSGRRARSIAGWFRDNGLKIPIYHQGFGEEVLAVDTPDETEEARNRRALYILSSHVPGGPNVPATAWKKL